MPLNTKRVALFAHYDRDGIIDDYVVHYLRELTKVANRILFISDSELRPGEADKLESIAEFVSASRHGEYDFGSWKRGFDFLGDKLSDWDEIIIANDSCYAPVFPFEDIFTRMALIECDFWGPTAAKNEDGLFDHVNSYFVVFRRPILCDEAFAAFWRGITSHKSKKEVIDHYEIGLSQLLLQRGYRGSSVVPPSRDAFFLKDEYLRYELQEHKLSWIKVNIFRDKPHRYLRLRSMVSTNNHLYPSSIISVHLGRMFNGAHPARDRFLLGTFFWAPAEGKILAARGKVKKGRLWKFYAYLFGIPFFALVIPLFVKRQEAMFR